MAEIDPATGQPVVQHGTKSPMWDLFGAAQQSGILDTLLQPQNSNVLSMLSQFRPQTNAAASGSEIATGLPGTFGVPWDQGREPYASNDTYRDPYNFDKSYWDQRAQMSAGFRQSLNKMPGVFDPLSQATSGYPFFQPNTAEQNKQTMYQLPPGGTTSFGPWTPGKQPASGAIDSGLLAGLTPEQKSQLLMLLQNASTGGTGGTGGTASGMGTVGQLPRPQEGFPSRPGFNEPGGWQWDGATWQWIPQIPGGNLPVAGGSPAG
jgi:hypothetical protein